jgi:hypothetical protein
MFRVAAHELGELPPPYNACCVRLAYLLTRVYVVL